MSTESRVIDLCPQFFLSFEAPHKPLYLCEFSIKNAKDSLTAHPAHFFALRICSKILKNIRLNENFSHLGVDFSEKVYIIYSVEIEKETLYYVTSIQF